MTLTVNGEFAEWLDAVSPSEQAMVTGPVVVLATSPVDGEVVVSRG